MIYDAYVFCSLPLVRFFFFFFFFFLCLSFVVVSAFDLASRTRFGSTHWNYLFWCPFFFFFFLSLLFINIMASVAPLYIYMHNINIFLSHCPWQIYQVISFFPLFFPPFPGFVCVVVFGCLSLDASYFCPFLLSGW